jgi:hypothetical protein
VIFSQIEIDWKMPASVCPKKAIGLKYAPTKKCLIGRISNLPAITLSEREVVAFFIGASFKCSTKS